ncbi:hypothetical protein EL26_24010 [Tumebacillus flagellatus]|uniref:SLH domain-containing protein n=1 Tax=Tumebacillus flagellatus TaxID=1157490 RepID=A0A074LLU3_9BACL|nr:hypothetical protein EL26_24010 [Tumebacillus flagellatus]
MLAASGNDSAVAIGTVGAAQQIQALGLMTGDANGDFRSGEPMSRAEVAKMLCKLFSLQTEPVQGSFFADVDVNSENVAYIEAVHKAGLMIGDATSFRPNEAITGEEMAVILARGFHLKLEGKGTNLPVEEQTMISQWAQDSVRAVRELGFLKPGSNGLRQPLLRGDMANVLLLVVNQPVGEATIGDGSVTISGIRYGVTDSLQGVFQTSNANALKGAQFNFTRDGFKIAMLTSLELNQADSVLDGHNATGVGDLVVNAPMTVKNLNTHGTLQVQSTSFSAQDSSFGTVVLKGQNGNVVTFHATGNTHVDTLKTSEGKSSIQTDSDATIESLQLGDNSTEVELKGSVKNLVISAATHAKVKLVDGARIDAVTMPDNANLRDYIVDYDDVKANIPIVNNSSNPDNRPAYHAVNKKALNDTINGAVTWSLEIQVGTNPGQVPQSAHDDLQAAIEAAQTVANKKNASQREVNDATAALTQAIQTFRNAIIAAPDALTISLAPAAQFPLNSGLSGTSGDVLLTDDAGMVMTTTPLYNKRNIKNLIQVKRGATVEKLSYDAVNHDFIVSDPDNTTVGTVSLNTVSQDLQINSTGNGFTIHPLDAATEASSATIDFTLDKTDGSPSSTVSLPISFDQTAPTWTNGSYSNHVLTLTSNESIAIQFPEAPTVSVEYSQSGDFSDSQSLSQVNNDLTSVLVSGNTLSLQLTDTWLSNHTAGPNSKFRLTTNGYYDLAKNSPVSNVVTIDVSQF